MQDPPQSPYPFHPRQIWLTKRAGDEKCPGKNANQRGQVRVEVEVGGRRD